MTSPSTPIAPPMRILYASTIVVLLLQKATGFQRFVERPQSVEVMEGEDVFLECVVEDQQGKAQWTKDGFALGFERGVPGYPRYSYSGDPSEGQHNLIISAITITEDGEYQCQVGPTDTNPPIWAAANVTVLVAPTSIAIVGWENGAVVEIMSGASLVLECLVTDARPVASIIWYKDGNIIDQSEVEEEEVESSTLARRWNVRSRLVILASAEDDGKLYTCEADHPALRTGKGPLLASITLSVLHPPDGPSISGYRTGEVLVSGERRTLVCRVSGGNPRPRVTWWRGGGPPPRGLLLDDTSSVEASVVTNAHQLTPTAAHDGALYQCRAESDLLRRPLLANVTITVYYSPSSVSVSSPARVHVGANMSLTCETSESNPPAGLTWLIDGRKVTSAKEITSKVSTGGWASSSELTYSVERSSEASEVKVECRAINPAIDKPVSKTITIAITKPAGPPEFEGDPARDILAGTTFDLVCRSRGGRPPPSIRIFKENVPMDTETKRSPDVTRAVARLQVTQVDQGAKITCEVSNPATDKPLTSNFRLSVSFPPWEVVGSATPPSAEEGTTVTLSCQSSPSRPASNITWRAEGHDLEGASVTSTRGAFGGTSTRSEVSVRATAADDGKAFLCEADNGLGPPVKTSITLQVLHSPVWVTKPSPQIDVHEGTELVVHAKAAANPGPPSYLWRRNGETLPGKEAEMKVREVSRSQTGNYSVTASSDRGSINATFFVNVQYEPEQLVTEDRLIVKEGGSVSTLCSAAGNPTPNLTWTREATLNLNSPGAPPLGTGVGAARLTVEGASGGDTGVYFCHARNAVARAPPAETRVIVEQGVTGAEEEDERSGSWAAVGGVGRLECRVRAAPPPTFVWSSEDGLIILNSEKYTIHEPQLLNGLVLWSSTLEVRHVSPEDFTEYICTSKNLLGSHTSTLTLEPSAPPQAPINVTVSNVTGEDMWLTWTPNLDGVPPSGYTLKYKPSGSSTFQYVEVGGGGTSSVWVGGLSPSTEYTIGIQAKNEYGQSGIVSKDAVTSAAKSDDPTTSLHEMANDSSDQPVGLQESIPEDHRLPPPEDDTSGVPRLILLIMTLTGAALLILNISIIACFVRRRTINRNPSVSSSSKSTAPGSGVTTPTPTPALTYSQLLQHSSNTLFDSPPGYEADDQTNLEEHELGILMAAEELMTGNGRALPHRNGGILTANSTFLAGPLDEQDVSGNHLQRLAEEEEALCSSHSVSPHGEHRSYRDHDLVNGISIEPDVCSVGSTSLYEHTLHEHRRDSDPYPLPDEEEEEEEEEEGDRFSLCSNRSNSSRAYSHGLLRPVPTLMGSLQHQQTTPQLIQDTLHALPRLSPPQHRQQNPPEYSTLNPSDLYHLRPQDFDHKCNFPPFTREGSNNPLGYYTLGHRHRRSNASQFTSLERRRRPSHEAHQQHCGGGGGSGGGGSSGSRYLTPDLASHDLLRLDDPRYDLGECGPQDDHHHHHHHHNHHNHHGHHSHQQQQQQHQHQQENSGSSGYSSSSHHEPRKSFANVPHHFSCRDISRALEEYLEEPQMASSAASCRRSHHNSPVSENERISGRRTRGNHDVRRSPNAEIYFPYDER